MQLNLIRPELHISDYSIMVSLGCTYEEQGVLQEVLVSIKAQFKSSPKGEDSDLLEDTLCYAKVCEVILYEGQKKSFQLIEHLSSKIYSRLKKIFPEYRFQLNLKKVKPPIKGLKNGVHYICGDSLN